MTLRNKRSLIALILSFVLVISMFTVVASATDAATADATAEATVETSETTVETTASSETTSETKAETETKKETTTESSDAAAIKETQQTLIINGIIIAVILVIIAVVAIKFRKKLGEFMRSVKSEFKKIVWSSKENTRKSFIVVLVVALAVALILWVIDLAFNTGLSMLHNLFEDYVQPLFKK